MSSGSDTGTSQRVNTQPRVRVRKMERVSGENDITAPRYIKAPPFWPEKPNIWFRQVEGQFKMFGIVDEETKFYQVLASLDRQYAAEVEDIITGPPDYSRLKAELIKRLSASRDNKIKQLLMHEAIGDRKPSQFLRHLQHLAGPEIPEDFLKSIWTSRLPNEMQPIVASQPTLPLDALADLADRIHDISTQPKQVAAATPSTSVEQLAEQVAELTRQVSTLLSRDSRRSQRRERGRARGRSRSRSQPRRSRSNYNQFSTCWYHHKFGSAAKNCMKPCDFKPAGNGRSNQ